MSTVGNARRGEGSIIGGAFLLLILIIGYALFLTITRSQASYENVLKDMRQRDQERSQEMVDIRRLATATDGKLSLTMRNNGPTASQILYLGIFDRTTMPETQAYYPVDIRLDSAETLTHTNPDIVLTDGRQYVVQLVTEAGNAFSRIFAAGTDVSDDTTITITPGGMWTRFVPSSYSHPTGTHVSGTVPISVQRIDADYLVADSVDLSPVEALMGYRTEDGGGANYPKYRSFSDSWTPQSALPSAGSPVRQVRVAYCPRAERSAERLVVTLSEDGGLDAYVFNGVQWTQTSFGPVWSTAPNNPQRPYDIAYEGTSGRALVVYANTQTDGTRDLSYRIWDGTAWSVEQYIDDTGHSSHIAYRWVALEANPTQGSNQIAMVAVDQNNNDANALIWDGTTWGSWRQITGSISTTVYECAAVAYEYSTGNIVAVAGQSSLVAWTRYTSSWSTPATFDVDPSAAQNMRWLALRTHRVAGSNRLMLLSHGLSNVASAVDWTGSSWGTVNLLDVQLEGTDSRCLDGDWEPSGATFVAAAADRNVDALSFKTWTPLGGWVPSATNVWSTFSGLTRNQRWVQVRGGRRQSGVATMLIGTVDTSQTLIVTCWNGTAMSRQTTITSSVGTLTYETFQIAFPRIIAAGTYSASTVFSFTGISADPPSAVRFKIVSDHNVSNVGVVVQAWDYSSSSYASGGQGYLSYTSAGANETAWLNITSGMANFIQAGSAMLRISSQSSDPFKQRVNLVNLDCSYPSTSPDLPFNTYRTFRITILDGATGNPRPFASLVVSADGSTVIFDGVPNPAFVHADAGGNYDLVLKSSNPSGETFSIHVLVGSVAAEKRVVQTPMG